jgi:hypothetical protein
VFDESRMQPDLMPKCELPGSNEIAVLKIFENAEPSINSTL